MSAGIYKLFNIAEQAATNLVRVFHVPIYAALNALSDDLAVSYHAMHLTLSIAIALVIIGIFWVVLAQLIRWIKTSVETLIWILYNVSVTVVYAIAVLMAINAFFYFFDGDRFITLLDGGLPVFFDRPVMIAPSMMPRLYNVSIAIWKIITSSP